MSCSGAESSMEDRRVSGGGAGNRRRRGNGFHNNNNMEEFSGDGCGNNPQAWNAFAESFSEVQTVLDRNRMLIQQANENHQSRIPDNMKKNVAIIQELNGNITKVASIYSDLSMNFSGKVRQQQPGKGSCKGGSSS